MLRKSILYIFLIIPLALSACNLNQPATQPAVSTNTTSPGIATVTTSQPAVPSATAPGITPAPTDTSPAATALPVASNTPVPTATSSVVPVSIPASTNYIDDRSTPWQVIVSFYNAITRQEYSRAYGYWNDPATSLGAFNAYANGYQNTASVDLVFGQIAGDAHMSQVDYTVPVLLKVTNKDSSHSNFVACYVVHETSPDVFGAPPFNPMSISQGAASPSDINAQDASVLASACSGLPVGGVTSPITPGSALNIDKTHFIDNRSGPIETVSSLLNALNLKQYVRAYSYFQDPATFPGDFSPYAAGYANTEVITVTFGTPTSEGAAGSIYYKVPRATKVLTTTNTTQTFVGCYTVRLAQPGVQVVPPFHPMGIVSGKFVQVNNSTDVNPLLPTACN